MISTTSPPTPPPPQTSLLSSQQTCKLNNSNNSNKNNYNQSSAAAAAATNDLLLECNGCHRYIHERYYLLVMDQAWHIECLRCNACKLCLDTQMSCFHKDGLIYCKDDYFK